MASKDLDWTFRTNLYELFWITKAAIPHLPPGSAIINTSSIVAFDPSPHLLDYSATKAAILNFTRGLAKQLATRGIRVNAVAPGPFWTALQPSGGQSQEHLQEFGGDTPLGRPGQPAEITPLYVLLASSEASFVTGLERLRKLIIRSSGKGCQSTSPSWAAALPESRRPSC